MVAQLLPVGVFVVLLRETLEQDPFYSDLWLEGEISDISRSAAGHTYFTLRDEHGALKCVLFRGQRLRQLHEPRLGDHVAVHGGLSIYPQSGTIQCVVDLVQPAGLGASALELAYLRQRLEFEGLFDDSRKRPLPTWPAAIGVVTSRHGAAWHDIQSVIRRRYPLVTLILSHATVQGSEAAESIAAALVSLQREDVDVIILARGGGSNDDLAAFNEEVVVRAVHASRVPVVTGIGHATDRTLAEDAADLPAPTPSAAAELCVPSVSELSDEVRLLSTRLAAAIFAQRIEAASTLAARRNSLLRNRPTARVLRAQADVQGLLARMSANVASRIAHERTIVDSRSDLLTALSPMDVLRRGYAALQHPDSGLPVFSVTQVKGGAPLTAIVQDGAIETGVLASVPSAGAA